MSSSRQSGSSPSTARTPSLARKGRSKDFVKTPLPEYLITMRKDNLLLNAKREAFAEIKKQLFADPKAM